MSDVVTALAIGSLLFGSIVLLVGWVQLKALRAERAEIERCGGSKAHADHLANGRKTLDHMEQHRQWLRNGADLDQFNAQVDEKWRMRHMGQPDALEDQQWDQAWSLINEILKRRGWALLSEGNRKSYNLGILADAMAKLDGLASLRSVGGIQTIEYTGKLDADKAKRWAELTKDYETRTAARDEPNAKRETEYFRVYDWCPADFKTGYVGFLLGEAGDIVMTDALAENFAESLLKQIYRNAKLRKQAHDEIAKERAEPKQHIDQDRFMGRPDGGQGSQGVSGESHQYTGCDAYKWNLGGPKCGPGWAKEPDVELAAGPYAYGEDHRGQQYAWPARHNLSPEEGKTSTPK